MSSNICKPLNLFTSPPNDLNREICCELNARYHYVFSSGLDENNCRYDVAFTMYNHHPTMVPDLPISCPIDRQQILANRKMQRDQIMSGIGCLIDVIDKEIGKI